MTNAQDRVEEGLPVDESTGAVSERPSVDVVPKKNRLSTVSKMYDLDGDGELDEAEQAMRDMDKSGKGYLSNEKVYALMQDHMETQRELFKVKKVVIGLVVFVVILALSNLGTSFAAAYLAKDTSVDSSGELVNTQNGEIIGTQSAADVFMVDKVKDAENTRRLCTQIGSNADKNNTCATSSYADVPADVGSGIINKCTKNHNVYVTRTFTTGLQNTYWKKICPDGITSMVTSGPNNSPTGLTITYSNSETVTVQKKSDGNYELGGNFLLQDAGMDCDRTEDCDSGLTCDTTGRNPVCAAPATDNLQAMGEQCDDAEYRCGAGLQCYNARDTSCFNYPCGVCVCADNSACTSPSVCVDDVTTPGSKTCGCEIGTTNGCDPNSEQTFCHEGMIGGICGCQDADCTRPQTCGGPEGVADWIPSCGDW